MQLVFNEVLCDPKRFQKELKKVPVPPTLSSQYDRPSKEEVVATQMSRFNPVVAQSQRAESQHSSHQGPGTADESATPHTTG